MSMQVLNGTLLYVSVERSADCFDKDKGQEWKASIVVDEDTADAFGEIYPKQPAKKVKTSEFEDKYGCAAPEDAGKSVYIITLRKNTKLSNGNDVPEKYRPRVFLRTDEGKEDITFDKLVGNGSVGKVSIEHYEGKRGPIARLKSVLVTDLVEYVREGSDGNDGSEFDDEAPKAAKSAAKAPAKPAKAPAKSKAADMDDFEDQDVPF